MWPGVDAVCEDMPYRREWTKEKLQTEALKYKIRAEFKARSNDAYTTAKDMNTLVEKCQHMRRCRRWSDESLNILEELVLWLRVVKHIM